MTELQKLKHDRDVCYTIACAFTSQEFINSLCFEGDEIDAQSKRDIYEAKWLLGQLDPTEGTDAY